MSVLIETTCGDIVLDLFFEKCPKTCQNFLELCNQKYYNNNLFYSVEKDFVAKTGDPTNTGDCGYSAHYIANPSEETKYIPDEIQYDLRHTEVGTVGMINQKRNQNGSQFYITLVPKLTTLDGHFTIFAQVTEGLDVLHKINHSYVDASNRPLQNIRIKHIGILHNPLPPISGLSQSVESPREIYDAILIPSFAEGEEEEEKKGEERRGEERRGEIEKKIEMLEKVQKESRAVVLELLEDLPDAAIAPQENVLFICQLNPATTAEDLQIIFSRFGTILSCEVVKDHATGRSLQYAFIEFETIQSAELAWKKMHNVLIDDRRIHVDFSQSVSKQWSLFKRQKRR